jgi:uncharacterized membrane protein required for colicin V production
MGYVFDFVVVFAILASLLIGLRRGLIKEVVDLVAAIAGAITTAVCQHLGIGMFDAIGGSVLAGRMITMLMQFVVGAGVVWIL